MTKWWSRRTCAHLLWELQNTTYAEQLSTGGCWIPPKKDTPHPKAKEKLQQDGRRGEIVFRSKPHTRQRHWAWRVQTKPCVLQDLRERSNDPTRDWPRLAREFPGISGGGVGRWWPAAGSEPLGAAVHAQDLLKEVAIVFITSTRVWSLVKQQWGPQPRPSTESHVDGHLIFTRSKGF